MSDNDTKDSSNAGNGSGVPLLKQYDSRWADSSYGDGTIATSACGPTSFAMIARWYGKDITPVDAADWAQANGMHGSDGTAHSFPSAAAENWGFSMTQTGDIDDIKKALSDGFPCMGAHGPGMFTNAGHYIVYAKLVDGDKLIVNDPNSPNGPNKASDDYQFSFDEVMADNNRTGFIAWYPTTSHDGIKPLMELQSDATHGNDPGNGSGPKNPGANDSQYKDCKFRYHGEFVTITYLPEKKTYAEPIYPDLVTVSDYVPKWALDKTIEAQNDAAMAAAAADKDGKTPLQKEYGKFADDFNKFKDDRFNDWLKATGNGYTNADQLKQCKAAYEKAAQDDPSKFESGMYVGDDADMRKKAKEYADKEHDYEKKLDDEKKELEKKAAEAAAASKTSGSGGSEYSKFATGFDKFKEERFNDWLKATGYGYTNADQLNQCKEAYAQAASAEPDKFESGMYVGSDADIRKKAQEYAGKETDYEKKFDEEKKKKEEEVKKENKTPDTSNTTASSKVTTPSVPVVEPKSDTSSTPSNPSTPATPSAHRDSSGNLINPEWEEWSKTCEQIKSYNDGQNAKREAYCKSKSDELLAKEKNARAIYLASREKAKARYKISTGKYFDSVYKCADNANTRSILAQYGLIVEYYDNYQAAKQAFHEVTVEVIKYGETNFGYKTYPPEPKKYLDS
jgi:hypothetical protein